MGEIQDDRKESGKLSDGKTESGYGETADRRRESSRVNRVYKSRIFAMIFQDKEKLLELYNAISGKNYTDPELLEINTMENAIYMNMQNDLSFLIDARLSLYEHQSTVNPNLPLRFLWYISKLYMGMTRKMNIYGAEKVEIPEPQFVVFYNGVEEQPERKMLRLSDLYQTKTKGKDMERGLELMAVMYNVNRSHNKALMEASRTLRDYAEYVYRVRKYAEETTLEEAVERAITECIREGILKDFLEKHRAEAKSVSIFEYDEEEHMRQEREQFWNKGMREGRRQGIQEGIQRGLEMGKAQLMQSEQKLLWNPVQKKLEKGKSISQIAEELESTEEEIQKVIERIKQKG
ncbi:MAG: hypothetical protein U0N90_07190 [Blautia sp.]